jgi:amino acid adenylation domain-containing protein
MSLVDAPDTQLGGSLSALVRAAAACRPDHPALRSGNEELTYSELDSLVDCVASCLLTAGVVRGDRVALYLPKGLPAIASLYGAFRIGAVAVPIDPGAPALRAGLLLTQAEPSFLVTEPSSLETLVATGQAIPARGLLVEESAPEPLSSSLAGGFTRWRDCVAAGSHPPDGWAQGGGDDLALLLFTSGSTGVPSGVMITHNNVLSFVDWARRTLEFRSEDIFANHAPLHFDLSTLDLFGAASVGATVSLVPRSTAAWPPALASWIRDSGITVWYSVPSALRLLQRLGGVERGQLGKLRLVLFAGEVFPSKQLRPLMDAAPQARYFNLYGPTETNVCTYYEVCTPPDLESPPVPIGVPCDPFAASVIGEDGRETCDGTEGELVVRGPGVASGYWRDPEKTARRFGSDSSYCTGDIVRWTTHGEHRVLEFVGRRDHLVKTRGYRVELGELEALLISHPAMAEAIVVAVPDELLGNRLAAFCSVSDPRADQESLLGWCRERLPAYLVPDRIWLCESLPHTPNGKADRVTLAHEARQRDQIAAFPPTAPPPKLHQAGERESMSTSDH